MAYIPIDKLREMFADVVTKTCSRLELAFCKGEPVLQSAIFGTHEGDEARVVELQWETFSSSRAWYGFSQLYNFAVKGELHDRQDPHWRIGELTNLLSVLQHDHPFVTYVYQTILPLAQGRSSLENGFDVPFEALVQLANVDERTVRNAISAGELVHFKNDGKGYIRADSARQWLERRRGFTPTRYINTMGTPLDEITTPEELAEFLIVHRTRNRYPSRETTADIEPDVRHLEQGICDLPLDRAARLADFYCLDRSDFLDCLLRIYFPEQYALLRERRRGPINFS